MSEELKPCPFCGGKMFFQKALWPSDGNVDSIIHDGVSQCGMVGFSIGTTDESVMAAWNTRATEATLRAENELMRGALADLVSWFPETKPVPEWKIRAGEFGADDAVEAARNALAQVAK